MKLEHGVGALKIEAKITSPNITIVALDKEAKITSPNNTTTLTLSEGATGTYGFNCESRCDTCVANICETRDGNCTYGCYDRSFRQRS
jgi:hypothetical protein